MNFRSVFISILATDVFVCCRFGMHSSVCANTWCFLRVLRCVTQSLLAQFSLQTFKNLILRFYLRCRVCLKRCTTESGVKCEKRVVFRSCCSHSSLMCPCCVVRLIVSCAERKDATVMTGLAFGGLFLYGRGFCYGRCNCLACCLCLEK